jgi:hypothetical protein
MQMINSKTKSHNLIENLPLKKEKLIPKRARVKFIARLREYHKNQAFSAVL